MAECFVLTTLSDCFSAGNFEDGLRLLKEGNQRDALHDKELDLIPIVCKYVSRDEIENNPSLEYYSEEILSELARHGNAKEVLIGLLEQVDNQEEDIKFKILLKPIQIVLERIQVKRSKSLDWVLTVLHSYVTSLPLPRPYGFEDEERKLLDLDPDNQRIVNVLSNMVLFYEPFVSDLSVQNRRVPEFGDGDIHDYRNKLTLFLLQLLDRPLVFLDLSNKCGDSKSTIYTIAEKLVTYIKRLQSNFYNLLTLHSQEYSAPRKLKPEAREDSENKVTDLSLATLFYLVYAEGIECSHLPCVYTHIFIVESCLPFINAMLKRSEECVTQKGILLAAALIQKIREKELRAIMLDSDQHMMFPQNLINVALQNQVQEFRRKSAQLLHEYIAKYDDQGRYQLLKCLLSSNEHAGVQGLLIQVYKDNLLDSIRQEPVLPYFIGIHLKAIFGLVAHLPDAIETNVLDQSDRILGVLNLIRFLALRDNPSVNVTGFWDLISDLEKGFLNPLRKALDISRAHYQLELNNFDEKTNVPRVDFGVPVDHSQQMLRLALSTFDMIDSVLSRVVELISCDIKL